MIVDTTVKEEYSTAEKMYDTDTAVPTKKTLMWN